ncbi:hypothetical protein R3P38DRAFT_3215417 [Favolaschia claudopus]|uniref:F-box protein n=1 Tax=Favolaschia claudopus TaxID=2862362 RepID=A0AAW0A7J3_9AGAR
MLDCYDVMEVVLEYTNFKDLWSLAQTDKALQLMIRRFFRTRVDRQIAMFLKPKSPPVEQLETLLYKFWERITLSHSAVHGSLLLYMERCVRAAKPWVPGNLNIAVPFGAVRPWIRYFSDESAGTLKYREVEVDSFVLWHIASRWELEIIPGKFIIITETRGPCVAEAVIVSPHTANMQLLTRDFLIMYYPQKAFDESALDSWHYPTIPASQDLDRRGVRKSIDNSSWVTQCGWACPILWRRVSKDRGTLIFRVGDDTAVLDRTITCSHLKWRLGDTCYNSECKNYATHYYPYIPGYFSALGAELRSTLRDQ